MSYQFTGKFYEDFIVGETLETPSRTITESDIVAFANLTGDYNPLHTDEEYAKQSIYGKRIGHGILTVAIAMGLQSRLGLIDGTAIGLLGMECKFLAPVFIGDTIQAYITVLEKKDTSKDDRGIVNISFSVSNQNSRTICEGKWTILVWRRSPQTILV